MATRESCRSGRNHFARRAVCPEPFSATGACENLCDRKVSSVIESFQVGE
jgi:hypothetical protein